MLRQLTVTGSPGAQGDIYYGFGYSATPSCHDCGAYNDDTYSRDPYYHRYTWFVARYDW